jgi:hypothetical protein
MAYKHRAARLVANTALKLQGLVQSSGMNDSKTTMKNKNNKKQTETNEQTTNKQTNKHTNKHTHIYIYIYT